MPTGVYDRSPATRKKLSEEQKRRWQKRGKQGERAIAIRLDGLHATLQEIGDLCHISRERVRQILQAEGLPTCSTGEMEKRMGTKACKTCGKKIALVNKTGYCQKHLRDGITHCPSGHPYNEGNTYINKKGDRICRACARKRARRFRRNRDKCQDCGGPCCREAKRCRACWLKSVKEANMAYLLREGKGKGVALYTRCEDVLLAEAELLLLKERMEKDSQYDGRPIYGFLDVAPSFPISEFKRGYRGNSADYRRLMELRQQILTNGWNYPEVSLSEGG